MHTLSRQTECTSLLLPECSTYTPVKPCKRNRIIDWIAASPPHTALSTLQEYLHLHRTSSRNPHPRHPTSAGPSASTGTAGKDLPHPENPSSLNRLPTLPARLADHPLVGVHYYPVWDRCAPPRFFLPATEVRDGQSI